MSALPSIGFVVLMALALTTMVSTFDGWRKHHRVVMYVQHDRTWFQVHSRPRWWWWTCEYGCTDLADVETAVDRMRCIRSENQRKTAKRHKKEIIRGEELLP